MVLTIYRSGSAAVGSLDARTRASLSKSERAGWEWLSTSDSVTSAEYAAALKVPNRTALNHLKHFTDLRLVRKRGSGPATRYEVVRT